MKETKMGNRGSKSKYSIIYPRPKPIENFVKEQRVDGSWDFNKQNLNSLRCTLMGCENSYQTIIPSKQFILPKLLC